METIQEYGRQIKEGLDSGLSTWGMPVLIILVGMASFGLGRLSAFEESRPRVGVGELPAEGKRALAPGGLIVASRTGSAYHFPWCSGAETIKEGNKIWFESEEAARRAGYTPAKNCTGLGPASGE